MKIIDNGPGNCQCGGHIFVDAYGLGTCEWCGKNHVHIGVGGVITDPDTGGRKGTKLARFDLLPPRAWEQIAEHYGLGAQKYDERNWEKGYAWSLSYAALQRHANAFWGGEDIDPDSGSPHLAAVVFHALSLLTFLETHPEKDDRSK